MDIPDKFLNEITWGDCTELIKQIPDDTIDVIFTDPPYGLSTKGIHNDSDLSLYYKILPDCHRVLKKDAWFITFFSTKHLPKLFDNNPFNYFWDIVLYCPGASVNSPVGYTKYMSCFVFKKGNPKVKWRKKDLFLDTPGKMVEPDEGFINHPTPKPKKFIKDVLEMFSVENDIVLDPFMGSGATAMACKQLNRKFIGFEIDAQYCSLAKRRLNKINK
jgi:site-specific DNA-methyltransferase (adenine-specific)